MVLDCNMSSSSKLSPDYTLKSASAHVIIDWKNKDKVLDASTWYGCPLENSSTSLLVFNAYLLCRNSTVNYTRDVAVCAGFLKRTIVEYAENCMRVITAGDFNCS